MKKVLGVMFAALMLFAVSCSKTTSDTKNDSVVDSTVVADTVVDTPASDLVE